MLHYGVDTQQIISLSVSWRLATLFKNKKNNNIVTSDLIIFWVGDVTECVFQFAALMEADIDCLVFHNLVKFPPELKKTPG